MVISKGFTVIRWSHP